MRSPSVLAFGLFFLLLACSTVCLGDLDDGLLLYYPFDTAEGSVVTDQSGHGVNGTNYGAAFTPAGRVGGAYEFDGVDDRIFVPANAALDSPDHFSLCAFFKPYDSRQQPILTWVSPDLLYSGVHMWSYVYGSPWGGFGTGAHLIGQDWLPNGNHVIAVSDPPVNEWHHLVVTYTKTSGEARLYLDGALAKVKNLGSYAPELRFNLHVGAHVTLGPDGGLRFCGLLDELRIYGRVLGEDEVEALYNGGAPSDPAYITLIGFSNDPEGEQDVTQFYRDETLYVRVRDVDLEADPRAGVRLMLQQSRTGARMIDLQRQEDGSFTGGIPLARFRPGPVRVFLIANGPTRLLKDSVLTILAE